MHKRLDACNTLYELSYNAVFECDRCCAHVSSEALVALEPYTCKFPGIGQIREFTGEELQAQAFLVGTTLVHIAFAAAEFKAACVMHDLRPIHGVAGAVIYVTVDDQTLF